MKFRAFILILMGIVLVVRVQAADVEDRMAAARRGEQISPAWEAVAISDTHGAVVRQGSRLIVRLVSGKMLSFVDTLDACDSIPVGDCQLFKFLAFLPKSHVFVVEKSYYEGCWDYLLIDDRSGRSVSLGAVPVFSPSGKRILVQKECVADGDDNHFEIWARQGAGWRREWAYTNRQAYDADPQLKEVYRTDVVSWRGDEILLRFETQMEDPLRRWTGRIVRKRDGWHLMPPQ